MKCFLLILFFLVCSSIFAQDDKSTLEGVDVWATFPIGQEDIYFLLPSGFSLKNGGYQQDARQYMQVQFKDGEDNSNWTDKIEVNVLLSKPNASDHNSFMVDAFGSGIQRNCPEHFYKSEVDKFTDNRLGVLMGCSQVGYGGVGVFGYYLFAEGKQAMYVISRVNKVAKFDKKPPISDSQLQSWKEHLIRTILCKKGEMCFKFKRDLN